MKPVCVVLAGGRSARMGGGDKALMEFRGLPMLTHVLAAVTPQAGAILINSNSNPALFSDYGLPVEADCAPGFLGPLAGLLTGMVWARRHHSFATHLLSVACDTPCLPADLAVRLAQALAHGGEIAVARDGARVHPTLGLWSLALADRLAHDLLGGQMRRMRQWLTGFDVREVEFDSASLCNINTPQDLAEVWPL